MAPSATYEDAAAGWAIFRRLNGEVSRPDLNLALNDQGHRSISPRTFNHYRKLLRLGYREYVSINRLDLRHSNRSVFDVSDRSRYRDLPFQSAGTLLIPRGRDYRRFQGRITRVSQGFASLLLPIDSDAQKIAKATKYKRGILHFESVGVERAVEVIEAQEIDGFTEVLLEFRSLIDTETFFPSVELDTTTSRIHVNLGAQPPLSKVVEVVRRSFDLLESSRAILETAIADQSPASAPATATPRVRRLLVQNPVDIVINVDPSALAVAGALVTAVVARFEPIANGINKLHQTYVSHQEAKRAADLHPLRTQSYQLENFKNGVETIKMLADIDPQLLDRLGIDLDRITPELLPKIEPLKDQGLEAATEIQMNSNEPIEISEIDSIADDEYEYFTYEEEEEEE